MIANGVGRLKRRAKASSKRRRSLSDTSGLTPMENDNTIHRFRRTDVCDEFANPPDLCMSAGLPPFSRTLMLFQAQYDWFVGCIIPVTVGIAILGEFSVSVSLSFCLLTLKVGVTPIPGVVADVGGYAAIGPCFVLCGGLMISGSVADLQFPLPISVA